MKKIIVVGSGFSSLSVASYLAQEGHQVDIFENEMPGGRARQFKRDGFTLTLAPRGIGCQTFLKVTLETLEKK